MDRPFPHRRPSVWGFRSLRSHLRLTIAVSALLAGTAAHDGALAGDAETEIATAYRARDAAYGRSDPEGLVASLGETLRLSVNGMERSLTKEQQVAAARFEVRPVPGRRIVRRETTALGGIAGTGGTAVVTVSVSQEVDFTDTAGTSAHVRDVLAFEDTWSLTRDGWRQTGRRQTGIRRTASGTPSPGALAALSNMRRQVEMLRGFNAANNRSYCMTADQNQKYDYQTRQSYCSD